MNVFYLAMDLKLSVNTASAILRLCDGQGDYLDAGAGNLIIPTVSCRQHSAELHSFCDEQSFTTKQRGSLSSMSYTEVYGSALKCNIKKKKCQKYTNKVANGH
ncbi:hypothetical protein RRG08_018354 [Elysia crispata]|uniref:Uncharacterized protein n=1 Tax=Elysia crispata TaxID=231223 RepID=A0AAE0Y0C6_9GAST|nr:hypothetical protein RRG08_018354 [Elysia crispata]